MDEPGHLAWAPSLNKEEQLWHAKHLASTTARAYPSGQELRKAFLAILGLMGIIAALLGFGRLRGWDVVTAIAEALADLLTLGG